MISYVNKRSKKQTLNKIYIGDEQHNKVQIGLIYFNNEKIWPYGVVMAELMSCFSNGKWNDLYAWDDSAAWKD